MKKFLFLLMALCLVVSIGASAFAFGPGPGPACDSKAAHPNFSDSHKIEAYVEPFAKITWGDLTTAYLQGDGSASSVGSIGVKVEANTSVKVDISGDGFKSTVKMHTDNGNIDKFFYLKSLFSLDGCRFTGTPSFVMDDTHKDLKVYYKAIPFDPAPGLGAIEATHAGTYEGNVTVTITNASAWNVRGPHIAGQL